MAKQCFKFFQWGSENKPLETIHTVVKVTPQRIYTRSEYSGRVTIYDHSGRQTGKNRGNIIRIDIKKTFPEGVKVMKEAECNTD